MFSESETKLPNPFKGEVHSDITMVYKEKWKKCIGDNLKEKKSEKSCKYIYSHIGNSLITIMNNFSISLYD